MNFFFPLSLFLAPWSKKIGMFCSSWFLLAYTHHLFEHGLNPIVTSSVLPYIVLNYIWLMPVLDKLDCDQSLFECVKISNMSLIWKKHLQSPIKTQKWVRLNSRSNIKSTNQTSTEFKNLVSENKYFEWRLWNVFLRSINNCLKSQSCHL